MGMKSSPYNAVQYFYLAEEFARGDPTASDNALRFDCVILNLPGMEEFDPSLPNVMKWNSRVQRIAGDGVTFVDDLRATGYDKENSWQVARQIAARLQYLGIQDAPRKKHPPSQTPGAWAGCVFVIDPDSIGKTVSVSRKMGQGSGNHCRIVRVVPRSGKSPHGGSSFVQRNVVKLETTGIGYSTQDVRDNIQYPVDG